jgi:hypothetical protein
MALDVTPFATDCCYNLVKLALLIVSNKHPRSSIHAGLRYIYSKKQMAARTGFENAREVVAKER